MCERERGHRSRREREGECERVTGMGDRQIRKETGVGEREIEDTGVCKRETGVREKERDRGGRERKIKRDSG